MRIVVLTVLTILSASRVTAQIKKSYDRFKVMTVVETASNTDDDETRPVMSLLAAYAGDKLVAPPPTVHVMFTKSSASWKYLRCFSTDFLLDSSPFNLGAATHDGVVGNGYVLEYIEFKEVPMDKIVQMATAHLVEVKICNDEFRLTERELLNLKEFVRALTPGADTTSSITSIVTTIEVTAEQGPAAAAAAEFMRAVQDSNMKSMASLWGPEQGSALKTGQPSDFARRMEIVRSYLLFDHVRVIGPIGPASKDKRIPLTLEVTRGRCLARIAVQMVFTRDGEWIVNSVDLSHVGEVLGPCRPQ